MYISVVFQIHSLIGISICVSSVSFLRRRLVTTPTMLLFLHRRLVVDLLLQLAYKLLYIIHVVRVD